MQNRIRSLTPPRARNELERADYLAAVNDFIQTCVKERPGVSLLTMVMGGVLLGWVVRRR
jgi:hypothetical protein